MNRFILSIALTALAAAAVAQPRASAPHGAKVYFIAPKNGATVHNPVVVKFGLKGMTIAPAGTNVVLTWPSGTLLEAPTLLGPWTAIPAAASPYTTPATNAAQFFKVHVFP